MKRVDLMLSIFVVAMFLTGCAQKLPVNTGNEVGILAIPMVGQKTGRGEFILSYELTHSVDHEFAITIIPGAGEKFVFSEILPAGDYNFDTLTTYAKQTITTMTSQNKYTQRLNRPLTIQIEAGKITLLPALLRVNIKPGDPEQFYQAANWEAMDDAAIELMKDRLAAMENADGWQIAN